MGRIIIKKGIMKKKIFTIVAATALLLGFTGCSDNDDPQPTTPAIDVEAAEKELVGIWWDEYEYVDVTETGVPFNHVLLAVEADEDHTGCIYLGVFDDNSDEPLAIYGGPEDAGFTWELLSDGTIVLGDPETGETVAMARSRADGGNYGNNMTNVSGTNLTYTNNGVTANNSSYSGTLTKADSEKAAEIEQKFRTKIFTNVDLGTGGNTPSDFTEDDIR